MNYAFQLVMFSCPFVILSRLSSEQFSAQLRFLWKVLHASVDSEDCLHIQDLDEEQSRVFGQVNVSNCGHWICMPLIH